MKPGNLLEQVFEDKGYNARVGVLHPNTIGHSMGQVSKFMGLTIDLSTYMRKGTMLKKDPIDLNSPNIVTKIRSRVGEDFIHPIGN
jgi:hypothetical protein